MRLTSGSTFAGYRIDGVAGRGGMGVVYRAQQDRPRRTVALKVIAPELSADVAFRARFDREAELAASIEHPNIVPVHEVGEHDGRLFIAMRFVDGSDLATILRDGPLAPERAVAVIERIASALAAAHHAGLVHRDVKPANVLIRHSSDGEEHVYLTDFGLARRAIDTGGLTANGQFMGTPGFAAPEQIRGQALEPRTDVYALGGVLFHALTAQTPYPRADSNAVMWAHVNDPPPVPSHHVSGLPEAFDRVVAMAMAKDPARRFESTTALARAARAALDHAPATCASCMAPLGDMPFCPHCGSTANTVPLAPVRPRPAANPPMDAPTAVRAAPTARRGPLPWVRLGAVGAFAAVLAVATLMLINNGQDPSKAALTADPSSDKLAADRTPEANEGVTAEPTQAANAAGASSPSSARAKVPRKKREPTPVAEVPVARTIAFHTGTDAGKELPAAFCRISTDQLYCWTPNDGYTLRLGASTPARVRGDEPANTRSLPAGYDRLGLSKTRSRYGFSCTNRVTGLSCQNTAGHGWTLPRYVGLPVLY